MNNTTRFKSEVDSLFTRVDGTREGMYWVIYNVSVQESSSDVAKDCRKPRK